MVREMLTRLKFKLSFIDTEEISPVFFSVRILEARIWLKDIEKDFAAMNAVWNAWVDPNNKV